VFDRGFRGHLVLTQKTPKLSHVLADVHRYALRCDESGSCTTVSWTAEEPVAEVRHAHLQVSLVPLVTGPQARRAKNCSARGTPHHPHKRGLPSSATGRRTVSGIDKEGVYECNIGSRVRFRVVRPSGRC
jgi:hypothetical protein